MKICLIAEGCYPYVVGGVSSWIHSMIQAWPQVEFILLAIIPDRSIRGQFKYELPENLSEVYEVYLSDKDWAPRRHSKRRTRLGSKEYRALQSIVFGKDVDWDTVFTMFQKKHFSLDDLLMGGDFLNIVQEYYGQRYPYIGFSDFLWTIRSIYLPLFQVLKTHLPKADIYHCVATGYAGVLGSMAAYLHGGALLISEHGIYTREREEELLKASWVDGIYKNIWMDQFQKMSHLAYERADVVTCLYGRAGKLQAELGCPKEKIRVTPNGIVMERLAQEDCQDGFILDGFPRTLPQALALDAMGVTIDKVLYLMVPDALIEERLCNRRVCEGCGATYHLINQPSSAGDLCEKCGSKLMTRKDDKPETIRERLSTYHQLTEPLVEYYRGQGKLFEIDGSTTIEAATEATLRILEGQE